MCDQISPALVLTPPFTSPCLDEEIQIVNSGKKVLNVAQDKSCFLEGNANGNRKLFFYSMV